MALDFEIITTEDPKKLVIVDSSTWVGAAGINITLPEATTPITLVLNKNLVNTFYNADLNVIEEELPDGLYTVAIDDGTELTNLSKDYLRTASLKKNIDKLYLRCYIDCDTPLSFVNKITDIELNLEAAYAHLNLGDSTKAIYFYKRAKEKVDKLLNCKTCT